MEKPRFCFHILFVQKPAFIALLIYTINHFTIQIISYLIKILLPLELNLVLIYILPPNYINFKLLVFAVAQISEEIHSKVYLCKIVHSIKLKTLWAFSIQVI